MIHRRQRSSLPLLTCLLAWAMVCSTGNAQTAKTTDAPAPTIKLTWARLAPLPIGVFDAAGTLLPQDRYAVTGGLWQSGLASDAVQLYDIKQDKWMIAARLSTARFCHAQAPLDGQRVLVFGGMRTEQVGRGIPVLKPELIDLTTQTVTALPDPPDIKPVRSPAACVAAGRVVIVSGPVALRFNPATLTWDTPIRLHESRDFAACVALDETRVLIVAGSGRDSFELLDLARGTSTLLPVRLPMKLDDMAVGLLSQDKAWISGGQDSKTGDTTDKTWVLSLGAQPGQEDATLTDGPDMRLRKGVADHRLVPSLPYFFTVGGESQAADVDTELPTVRALNLRTMKVHLCSPLPRQADDALAFEHAGRLIVVGGYYQGPPTLGGVRLPFASSDVFMAQTPEP